MSRVFLIGMMGAGKSYIGQLAAEELGMPFVDLDKEIERRGGRTIIEIFENEGEECFRKIEQETLGLVIANDLYPSGVVVAVGGGTPCHHGNMEVMAEDGVVVYLKRSVDDLLEYLAEGISSRPMLREKSGEELRQLIENILLEREQYYMKAHIVVERKGGDERAVVDLIKELYKRKEI